MTDTYTLEILPDPEVREFYENWRSHHAGDSGVDILCPWTIKCNMPPQNYVLETCSEEGGTYSLGGDVVATIGMKIRCRMLDPAGRPCSYYLYARSSISKTPLMLANSVGIIDAGYRGEIKGAFRHLPTVLFNGTQSQSPFIIHNQSLLQICAPNLAPVRVVVVSSLDSTTRGEGGFGSTS